MRIHTNRSNVSGHILDGLREREGIQKTASAEDITPPSDMKRVAERISANKINASFARSGYTNSTPSSENALLKEAEKFVADKATKYLNDVLKTAGASSNASVSVESVINVQSKLAGILKKRPAVSYADVVMNVTIPSAIEKSASVVVTIADGKPVTASSLQFGDNAYPLSKEGWQALVFEAATARKKIASTDEKHIVVHKFKKTAANGEVIQVPGGYYESLGVTENYPKVMQELKTAGIMYANKPGMNGQPSAIEPLIAKKSDLDVVKDIVAKYCQILPASATAPSDPADVASAASGNKDVQTAVVPKSSAGQYVEKLKQKSQGSVVEDVPGSSNAAITTIKTAATTGRVLEYLLELADNVYDKIQHEVSGYRQSDISGSELSDIKKELMALVTAGDHEGLMLLGSADVGVLSGYVEAITSGEADQLAQEKTQKQEAVQAPEFNQGREDLGGADTLGMDDRGTESIFSMDGLSSPDMNMGMNDMGMGQQPAQELAFAADRKPGTPWSEGDDKAPTKNQGPNSGGNLEVDGPGGKQTLTNNDGSKKAPAEVGREDSAAWSDGCESASGLELTSIGENKAPTQGQGPDGKATEVKSPGGSQKIWQQQNQKPGSTEMPKDQGTVEQFMNREKGDGDASGENTVDKFFTHEVGKTNAGAGAASGGLSPVQKNSAAIKRILKTSQVGPAQAQFRDNLMKKLGYSEDQISKKALRESDKAGSLDKEAQAMGGVVDTPLNSEGIPPAMEAPSGIPPVAQTPPAQGSALDSIIPLIANLTPQQKVSLINLLKGGSPMSQGPGAAPVSGLFGQ